MAITSVVSFGQALRQLQILDSKQLEELLELERRYHDVRALAKEFFQRGWLTAYQANQLFQGKGQELTLGQYVIVDRLGEGGMGRVFKARHRRLDRMDALKVIRKECLANAAAVQRFHQEARAAARVSHNNIVSIYDASEANGTHFLAMEYVEGIDLAKLVQRDGPLAIPQACEYIRQAALGLQHAHERGLVHRDIKPSNLFVNPTDGAIKVLDLGLARMLKAGPDADGGLTQAGAVMGTPDYISPEQAMNSRQVDIRSDIYSLGCTLYNLLTNQVPFPGDSMTEKLLHRHLRDAQPVAELRPEVPLELATLVATMMARKPEDRYATPGDVAVALEPFCEGMVAPAGARRRTGVVLPATGNPDSTATIASGKVTTALDPKTPIAVDGNATVLQIVAGRASAGFGRLSTLGRLVVGASVFGACLMVLLMFTLFVRAVFRGSDPVVAVASSPSATEKKLPVPPPPGGDPRDTIYQAFRLKNYRIEGGPQQRAGDQLGITYELANATNREVTIPADKTPGREGYSIGVCQHWIERLGNDATIPGIPLSAGRRGNLYSAGKSVVWVDRVAAKNQTYQFANPLETTGFPPGRYRYHIEYQKNNGELIQKEIVDFELTTPAPSDPRESLIASLIGKQAFPLEVDAWINGSPLSPADMKGKVVLLDFWAVWCPPCRAAFPHLRNWHEKYEKNGLVMIGLTRYYSYGWDEATSSPRKIPGLASPLEQEAMREFAKFNELKYRIGFVPNASDLFKRYAVGGIPHVVLIDRQGKIRLIKVGYSPGTSKTIAETIDKLLLEK